MTSDEKRLFAGMRAFDAMYARVEARLRDAAIRMLRDAAEVAEFMQDCKAFVLVNAASTFDPKLQPFADWAERMVVHECRNRRKVLDRELSLDGVGDKADPCDQIAQAESKIDFEVALSKLPPMQRDCFLRRRDGYSNSEIAQMFRISAITVRRHLSMARESLCGELNK